MQSECQFVHTHIIYSISHYKTILQNTRVRWLLLSLAQRVREDHELYRSFTQNCHYLCKQPFSHCLRLDCSQSVLLRLSSFFLGFLLHYRLHFSVFHKTKWPGRIPPENTDVLVKHFFFIPSHTNTPQHSSLATAIASVRISTIKFFFSSSNDQHWALRTVFVSLGPHVE